MKSNFYEVGYDCGDGYISVNLIEGDIDAVTEATEAHAKRHGYKVAYLSTVPQWYADEHRRKGMPFKKVP